MVATKGRRATKSPAMALRVGAAVPADAELAKRRRPGVRAFDARRPAPKPTAAWPRGHARFDSLPTLDGSQGLGVMGPPVGRNGSWGQPADFTGRPKQFDTFLPRSVPRKYSSVSSHGQFQRTLLALLKLTRSFRRAFSTNSMQRITS